MTSIYRSVVTVVFVVVIASWMTIMVGSNNVDDERPRELESSSHVRIAFMGNSMLYFNDCPRLLQQMIDSYYYNNKNHTDYCIQNSCLRGGASLPSLYEKGNGMQERFATDDIGASTVSELLETTTKPSWDYIILNDHTQAPARAESAQRTRTYLQQYYAPYFIQQNKNHHHYNQNNNTANNKGTKILLIQTPAYRIPGIKDSHDLGDFDTMTDAIAVGVSSYVQCLRQHSVSHVRMVPVGQAYRIVRNHHPHLFPKLYALDDFHPSPYGTWLQACVLFCIMFHQPPPTYNASWWKQSRYMMPTGSDDDASIDSFLPSDEEAQELAQIACTLIGVQSEESQK